MPVEQAQVIVTELWELGRRPTVLAQSRASTGLDGSRFWVEYVGAMSRHPFLVGVATAVVLAVADRAVVLLLFQLLPSLCARG
jgi:hypothetical protein